MADYAFGKNAYIDSILIQKAKVVPSQIIRPGTKGCSSLYGLNKLIMIGLHQIKEINESIKMVFIF